MSIFGTHNVCLVSGAGDCVRCRAHRAEVEVKAPGLDLLVCDRCVCELVEAGLKATKPATVRVPARFYDDHDERSCEPECTPVKSTKSHVWISLDDPGLPELLDDARHYACPGQFDYEYRGLVRSAEATVKAIEAALSAAKQPA